MIKSELIYYLNAIEKHHTLKAASESLYMTNPAFSIAIKNFEKKLGVPLIHKNNNAIDLTAEAKKILSLGQPVLQGLNEIELFVNSQINEDIKLAFSSGTSHTIIPNLISNCFTEPKINIDFLYFNSDNELIENVINNNKHVGILFTHNTEEIEHYTNYDIIMTDSLYLLTSPHTKFFPENKTKVSLDELENIPIISVSTGATMLYLLDYFHEKKFNNLYKQVNNKTLMDSYISADQGVGWCIGFNKKFNTQNSFKFIEVTDMPPIHCCLFSSEDVSKDTSEKIARLIRTVCSL